MEKDDTLPATFLREMIYLVFLYNILFLASVFLIILFH